MTEITWPSAASALLRSVIAGLSVWLCLAAAAAEANTLGPSFDCDTAQDPLAHVVCSDPALSKLDLQFVQAYQALRRQSGDAGAQALRREAVDFHNSVLQRCGVSAKVPTGPQTARCVYEAYQDQRSVWLARLTGAAAEEARRALAQHLALQSKLQQLGFLVADAPLDGVYGDATRTAIAAWQQSRGLTPTGLLGDADAAALQERPPPRCLLLRPIQCIIRGRPLPERPKAR